MDHRPLRKKIFFSQSIVHTYSPKTPKRVFGNLTSISRQVVLRKQCFSQLKNVKNRLFGLNNRKMCQFFREKMVSGLKFSDTNDGKVIFLEK